MKRKKYIFKLILCFIIALGLLLFVSPYQNSLAGPTPTPRCHGDSASSKICLENGFLTVANPSKTNAFNTEDLNIIDPQAAIPQFSLLTYPAMKSLYFDQVKSVPSKVHKNLIIQGDQTYSSGSSLFNTTSSDGELYNIAGSLTISSNISPFVKPVVIFVDNDLYINSSLTHTSGTAGLIFDVAGNVFIDTSVTQIDAFIIVHNNFCTASSGTTCIKDTLALPLLIKGSVIFLNNPPSPTPTPGSPHFYRKNSLTNQEPAEILDFQSKYLIILKDVFSKTLSIWKEVQ